MAVRVDPEGSETDALFDLVEIDGRDVLEIGCGDGRVTWRYAERVGHVIAIDPFTDGIAGAKRRLPENLRTRVEFRLAAFEDFAAGSEADVFDLTLLSWSLC